MKKLALALSAATVIVGIVAAQLWIQVDSERKQLADLRAQVTKLEDARKVRAAAARAALLAGTTADSTIAPQSNAPNNAANKIAREQMRKGIAKGVADVLASKEMQEMTKNSIRARLARQYPDLATALKLSPAEADKFMNLLASQSADLTGDALGMLGGGDSEAAQERQRKLAAKQLANEKEVARTLGSKYPQWQEYQGTTAAKQQVDQLRSLLGTSQDALTDLQTKPLTAAIGAEQARINREEQNRLATTGRSAPRQIDEQLKTIAATNERLANAASPHLTSNQLDRYKRMLSQQETMLRAMGGAMNNQRNAAGQAGAQR